MEVYAGLLLVFDHNLLLIHIQYTHLWEEFKREFWEPGEIRACMDKFAVLQ
jgi:hypothetical protein